MNSTLSFGDKLALLRKRTKISQRQLGEVLNINYSNFPKYENDVYMPTADILVKIANYFKVSLDYLLMDKPHIDIDDKELLELSEKADQLNDDDRAKLKNIMKSYLV